LFVNFGNLISSFSIVHLLLLLLFILFVHFLADVIVQDSLPSVSLSDNVYRSPLYGQKTFLPSYLQKLVNVKVFKTDENYHRFREIVGCQTPPK